MVKEIWKNIPGFEGYYQASNLGRVRSLDRKVRGKYGNIAVKKGKILKPNKKRYGQVCLIVDGVRFYPLVSHLVYSAFYGPIPEGMQVNHIDENPENNRLDNLNLMTPKENTNWGTGIRRRAATHSEKMKGKQLYEENPKARLIMEYDKEGNEFFLWYTIKAAAEYHKKDYTTIMYNLEGKSKTMRNGIYFRYYEKEAV